MIPQRALSDILSAERGLARLDEQLADPARSRRQACDAARRDVLAMATLAGSLVAFEDLLLALVSPDEVSLPQRKDANSAAALYRLFLALHDGLGTPALEPTTPPTDKRLGPETVAAWMSLAAETRRLLAEAEAALHDTPDAGQDAGESVARPSRPLDPWTLAWMEEIHARWYEASHGRRPDRWSTSEQEIAWDALRMIDEALRLDPGVVGAARALYRLHSTAEFPRSRVSARAGEDEQSQIIRHYIVNQPDIGWWPQFARIVAPLLVARACGLRRVWLPVSAYWRHDYAGYRLALGGSEGEWITWMACLLANAVAAESGRSAAIEALQARWIAATAVVPRLPKRRPDTLGPTRRQRAGTRRSTSRLPQFLDLLWEQPVVSTRLVERRLRMTYRSALDLIQDLERAAVLQRATDRKLHRLWRADTRWNG